jgi:hypothetical protein
MDAKRRKCNYVCNAIHFLYNYESWTSGNNNINKLIRDAQLSVHRQYVLSNALEWMPFDRFYDIKFIARGG